MNIQMSRKYFLVPFSNSATTLSNLNAETSAKIIDVITDDCAIDEDNSGRNDPTTNDNNGKI